MTTTQTHVPDDADVGALLALIDGELDAADARALEAHVAQCGECATRLASLRAATDFTTSVLAAYDVAAPSAPSRAIRIAARARELRSRFAAAAVLVLFLAAGAAALVPGSPVREWLETLFTDEPTAPAPMPAREASTRAAPSSTATMVFATARERFWGAWTPISVSGARTSR